MLGSRLWLLALFPCLPAASLMAADAADQRAAAQFFETRIRPVLVEHCYGCHSAAAAAEGKLRGGLALDTRAAARTGGDSGPAVVPGSPDESLLISALRHESFEMPPKGALSPAVIADFVAWIEDGAYDPREGEVTTAAAGIDVEQGRQFWSLRPLQQVAPPVTSGDWLHTPVDRFVLSRLHAQGIEPNPPAPARVLIRRAWFDLLGMPPSPPELTEWEQRLDRDGHLDRDAWADLIDSLLSSPHYGERWARHWMDVARFAESHGYEQDYDRPSAYHYRDFLIRAFNDDMPYDQFVRWQLAGDELAPDEPLAWMATGFLGAGVFPTQLTEEEFESARYDELDDMVATTGVAFLGLSVGCARCHDHKFDPIPAADYYRLAATFATTIRSEREYDFAPAENARRREQYSARTAELQQALERFETEVLPERFETFLAASDPAAPASTADGKEPNEAVQGALMRLKASAGDAGDRQRALDWFKQSLPEWQTLHQTLVDHEKAGPQLELTKVLVSSEGLPHLPHHADGRGFPHFYPETYHLRRGDVHQKEDVAQQGFLQVLMPAGYDAAHWIQSAADPSARTSRRRAALAAWLTDEQHGAGHLSARVMVNRLWQHHFGRGLVATPNDFGANGEPPTHPQLLDWLAAELIREDWRLKPLHKLMMTSSVYVQSNAFDEVRASRDRENRLLWRWTPRRLEAEAIRDSMLAVSGQLDRTMYGPGVLEQDMRRRSVYFFIKRSQLIPMMMLFDWPEHLVSIGRRPTTTIAPQALMFMNSPQARGYAEAFAAALPDDAEAALADAYRRALGRWPDAEERRLGLQFLAAQSKMHHRAGRADPDRLARTDFCQVLMSMNEFIYVE